MPRQQPPQQQQQDSSVFPGVFFVSRDNADHARATTEPRPGAVYVESTQARAVQSLTPIALVCPHCKTQIETVVVFERGMGAWLLATLMCLAGCCCFAWIPLVTNIMQDAVHVCPNCRAEVGRYIRLGPHPADGRRRRSKRRVAKDASQKSQTSNSSSNQWAWGSQKSDASAKSPTQKDSGSWSWANMGRSNSEKGQHSDSKRNLTRRERKARPSKQKEPSGSFFGNW